MSEWPRQQKSREYEEKLERLENRFQDFNQYVQENKVPIKEIPLDPKRLSQKDRELEVERVTRSYKNPADKKAVGFIADWRIDVREVRGGGPPQQIQRSLRTKVSWTLPGIRRKPGSRSVPLLILSSNIWRMGGGNSSTSGTIMLWRGTPSGAGVLWCSTSTQNLRAWSQKLRSCAQGEGAHLGGKEQEDEGGRAGH